MSAARDIPTLLRLDPRAEGVVPQTGGAGALTAAAAAAMAFLAVLALALALSVDRMAESWEAELAGAATIRIAAPRDAIDAELDKVLRVLGQTPGVEAPRALELEEQHALLAPWFGEDLPLETLPMPRLVEFRAGPSGYDAEGLRLRLRAEAPGAVLDDHARWRAPLVDAAARLRSFGWVALGLIGFVSAAMVTLAASFSLAANRKVIAVLRLVGAQDAWIARAFVRRFTFRATLGAALGMAAGMGAVALLPAEVPGTFLTGIGFRGAEWALALLVPPAFAVVAFTATRRAAFRALGEVR